MGEEIDDGGCGCEEVRVWGRLGVRELASDGSIVGKKRGTSTDRPCDLVTLERWASIFGMMRATLLPCLMALFESHLLGICG